MMNEERLAQGWAALEQARPTQAREPDPRLVQARQALQSPEGVVLLDLLAGLVAQEQSNLGLAVPVMDPERWARQAACVAGRHQIVCLLEGLRQTGRLQLVADPNAK
jgi:hypothetical protein